MGGAGRSPQSHGAHNIQALYTILYAHPKLGPATRNVDSLYVELIYNSLESQIAPNTRPLCPKVAHNSGKVAKNHGPLALQVAIYIYIYIYIPFKGAFKGNPGLGLAAGGCCHRALPPGRLWELFGDQLRILRAPAVCYYTIYLESQWPIIMGCFGSFMGYFGVE